MIDLDSKAKSIFYEVLDRASADERSSFLEAACGPDLDLRARVDNLLRAHRDAGNFLGGVSSADGTIDHCPIIERPGSVIGHYKLLQQIGAGGFGVVFEAEQERPVRRRVALKVIKPGMDTREVIARFEAERQALALMDHPGIAKVHDAGATENGRPYFVMELVHGVSITEYCDKCNLTTRERLELFVTVCEAVQHAHQKGVIHRDIKPSNVLVAIQDGQPSPKIIDFGVAKAINQQLTEHTLLTAFAQLVGTPLYMSPEQAELSPLGVDTRSDIYSLGVLLYELLTGTTPFERKRFKQASFDELRRIIREEEPPVPSARISTLAAELATTVAQRRRTNARRLRQTIRGELDWIVMKCLEKDRSRRYETANALMRDVERHLADEPVEARPSSAVYRFRKFYRRNRLGMTAAGFVAASLVVGVAGATWGLLHARKAEALAQSRFEEAVAERNKAEVAAEAEKRARLNEERQRKYAQGISRFVIDDFLALTSIEGQERFGVLAGESDVALNKDTTLRELLDRAAVKLQQRRDLEPLIKAELCWMIGVNYRGMGEYLQAVDFLERAVEIRRQELGDEHANTLSAENSLAVAYDAAGQFPQAIALSEHVANAKVKKFGADHPESLAMLRNLAGVYHATGKLPEAIVLFEQVTEAQTIKLGADHADTRTTQRKLAKAYAEVGRLPEAIALFEQIRDSDLKSLGPDHRQTLSTMNKLADAYRRAGKLSEAIALYEQVKEKLTNKLGVDHPHTLLTTASLAGTYGEAGNPSLAISLLEQVHEAQITKLGADHPGTLYTLTELAGAYLHAGRLAEAISLLERARDAEARVLGADHQDTLITLDNLARAYRDAGRLTEAIRLYESVREKKTFKFGADHPITLSTLNSLARAYTAAGRDAEAIALLEQVREARVRILGLDHPDTFTTMANLAHSYWSAKQLDKSIPLFESLLKQTEVKNGRGHPDTLHASANLGVNYKDAGRVAEAIPLLENAHRAAKQYPDLGWVERPLFEAYINAGRSQDANRLLSEVVAEVRQRLPAKSPELAQGLAKLGGLLLDAKAYDESEPFLRECLALREKLVNEAVANSGAVVRPWQVASAKSLLGAALRGKAETAGDGITRDKLLAEAEPLLVAGWAGLKSAADLAQSNPAAPDALPKTSRFNLSDALDRLINLFSALDNPDEVTKWEAEQAKLARDAEQANEVLNNSNSTPMTPPGADNGQPKTDK